MRPAHKSFSAGVLEVREQACFKLRSRSFKSIRNPVLRLLPFTEVLPIRSFFSFPKRGKVYLCQRNFTLETLLSKLPVRSCRNYLPRPGRLNQQRSSKTATLGVHEALASSKCLRKKKAQPLLLNSMEKKLMVAPSTSTKPSLAR